MEPYVHMAPPDRLDAILAEGLRVGRDPGLTAECGWCLDWYDENPVFLALPGSRFHEAFRGDAWRDHVEIEVDVAGVRLVADLPSLVDYGARCEEGYMVWAGGKAPAELGPYLNGWGGIEIEALLDPRSDACRAAIALTGTAACPVDVGPDRLTVRAAAPAP